jgi:hypothetical protein
MADGVAQVVERLLSKCEALSSNSNATKKKKKRGQQTVICFWFCKACVQRMAFTLSMVGGEEKKNIFTSHKNEHEFEM